MKRVLSISLALFVAELLFAADPYVGYIYPSGIQAGTTNRFVIGGQNLRDVKEIAFSNPDLHLLNIEVVPGFQHPTGMQRKHLKNWLDCIADGRKDEPPKPNDPHLDEWRSNKWWRALNALDAGQLAIVERDLYTARNALQDTPSLRQMILVTVAADADARPGWGTFSALSWNGISAPRPFSVSTLPRSAEPLYVPPHRKQPDPTFADLRERGVILEGQVYPGSTDAFRLRLAAGKTYAFRVVARELQPYIGDAVPGFFNAIIELKDESGNVVATADDETRFRPDPALAFTPSKEGDYRLEIHDVLYRGRADFVYQITIDSAPLVAETPGAPSPGLPPPDGVVACPGAISSKLFYIEEPGLHVLEVTARRRGSPLDVVLTLRKASGGEPLAQWDDTTNTVFIGTIPQGECDPVGVFDFREPGEYIAEITDRTRHAGDDYVWWLDVRRPTPHFEVYSTRSTLPLRGNAPLKVGFRILRKDGFVGTVTLEFPDDVRAKNAVATSGVDVITAELFYAGKRSAKPHPVKIFARAEIGGQTVRVPVVPCDEYEQAFAWHHLVPTADFLLRGYPGGKQKPKARPR